VSDSPFLCAPASAGRAEPLFGTASTVGRWLLVEQAGPWSPASFPESPLPAHVRESLQTQARRLGARPLLIRRHRTATTDSTRRTVFFVDSRPGRETVLRRVVRSDDELVPLALDRGWHRVHDPLYLVCSHGRHDTCCAMRGRPLAAALDALVPELTWECSHIGGDRFASNSLVLPAGLYYGRLTADDATELVARTRAGRVLPASLRGRSSLSQPAQAAQHFAQTRLGRDGVDDLLPRHEEQTGPDTWLVVLAGGPAGDAGPDAASAAGDVAVTVHRRRDGEAEQLTCHAVARNVAPAWDLVDLEVLTPVG